MVTGGDDCTDETPGSVSFDSSVPCWCGFGGRDTNLWASLAASTACKQPQADKLVDDLCWAVEELDRQYSLSSDQFQRWQETSGRQELPRSLAQEGLVPLLQAGPGGACSALA